LRKLVIRFLRRGEKPDKRGIVFTGAIDPGEWQRLIDWAVYRRDIKKYRGKKQLTIYVVRS